MKNSLKIIRLDGTEYHLKDYGIYVESFNPSAPPPVHYQEDIPGMHGLMDGGTDYGGRSIPVELALKGLSINDYYLLKNEVFRMFDSRQPFYVVYDREPGKRWKVKYNSPYSITPLIPKVGKTQIELMSFLPFAQSIGTTLDPLTFEIGLWQWGMNIPFDEVKYIHDTNSFQINNLGDEVIDPRSVADLPDLPLIIEYRGASSNLKIINDTTGDEVAFNLSTSSNDVIRIEGVQYRRNGLNIIDDTNQELISLAPGINNIRLQGTSGSFQIKFDFRFLYF